MATLKTQYGTGGQLVTITLDNLPSGSTWEGDAVSNETSLFLDVLISAVITTAAGTPSGDKAVYIYAYGTVDGGSWYSDSAAGINQAFTPTAPTNLRLLGAVSTPAQTTTYNAGPFSLAAAFGGSVPARWGIAVTNASGVALSGVVDKSLIKYQGLYVQSV